jgi:ribosomal protein L11 methylase PrmA
VVTEAPPYGLPRRFDWVTANLDLDTLTVLCGGLLEALRPRGRMVVSGLLSDQMPVWLDRLSGRPAKVLGLKTMGEWAAAVVERG